MNIKEMVAFDMKYNYTPDMAPLRYYTGYIPVFLWDDMRDHLTFKQHINGLNANDYKYIEEAYTDEAFLPWYNLSDTDYQAYCLRDYRDVDFTNADDYMKGTPQPMSGKVVGLSLKAIKLLDIFYANETKFVRQLINVKSKSVNKHGTKPITEVFAYFNELEDISGWNNTDSEWRIFEDIDLTPFREVNNIYEM